VVRHIIIADDAAELDALPADQIARASDIFLCGWNGLWSVLKGHESLHADRGITWAEINLE
jgi:hypothetical protein